MGVFESEHDMCISIHALLAESDQTNGSTTIPNFNFYPRSPCGERHLRVVDGSKSSIISIHALLAESDSALGGTTISEVYFYPRSPCGERLGSRLYDMSAA